jgi:hypothetical protein
MNAASDKKLADQEDEPGENGASCLHALTAIRDPTAFLIRPMSQTEIFKNFRARREDHTSDHPYYI